MTSVTMQCLSEGMLKVLLFLLVMVLLFLLYIELFSIKNYSEMYFAGFLESTHILMLYSKSF